MMREVLAVDVECYQARDKEVINGTSIVTEKRTNFYDANSYEVKKKMQTIRQHVQL